MNPILLNILAGCATQAVLSMFLWHRNLLSLPERVERIEADLKDIKAEQREQRAQFKEEMRELRGLILQLNERVDKLFEKIK